jgi:hypothetical protein
VHHIERQRVTVPIQDPIASYSGNGVATLFTVPFRILDAADLFVLLNGSLTTAYTVSGLGDDEASVTMSTPPAVGDTLILYREVALERLDDYQFNGDLRAVTVNADFDRIWMALQDIGDTASRAVHYPVTEFGIDGTLPGATDRASKIFGFDSNGFQTFLPVPASVGAGDLKNESWTDGVGFTAGTSTSVTLSRSYTNKANLGTVVMAGIAQDPASYSLVGTTLTFDAVIPLGITRIWCVGGTTVSLAAPSDGSVDDSKVAANAGIKASKISFDGGALDVYFKTKSTRVVTSIAGLKALSKTTYNFAIVAGYYASGDGGGGFYALDTADTTSADNRGTIIVADDGGRWKLSQTHPVSILQFGGKNDGVTDNTAALNAALAAATQYVGRVTICFPPGKYIFNSTITYTFPNAGANISIYGAGSDITELCWPTASIGLRINYLGAFNGTQIRDLSFTCGTVNTATALFLNQTAGSIPNPALSNMNSLTNVTFRGSDGYAVNNVWAFGMDVFAVSCINIINSQFIGNSTAAAGVGVRLKGSDVNLQGVAANFVNCLFTVNNIGIDYDQWYEGVAVSQCNFTGGQIGIEVPGTVGGQDELTITGCQINCAIAGVQTNEPMNALQVVGNLIISQGANSIGLNLIYYSAGTIMGNTFGGGSAAPGQVGITFGTQAGTNGCVVTGNNFVTLGTAILCLPASTKVNVQSNSYAGNTNNVNNGGTGNTIGGGSQ